MDLKKIFFWSDSVPEKDRKCPYRTDKDKIKGITKVGCPYKTTREEAEQIIRDLCSQYPENIFCGKISKSVKKEKKMGMIVDKGGEGVGIVTKDGEIRKLPSPIPYPLPQIASETGTVPIVESVEEGDEGTLSAQVKLGKEIKPLSPPPLPPRPAQILKEEIIPETTKNQDESLLQQIQKGIELKKMGKKEKCDIGFYWSQKLGKCISIRGDESQKDFLSKALKQKFKNISSPEESIEIVNSDDEW